MESSTETTARGKSSLTAVGTPALHHPDQEDIGDTIQYAQIATTKEHSMSVWSGIKLYPRAIGWSVLLSTAIVMEGYDVVLMGSFYAIDPFNRKYGILQPDGTYQLTAEWQAGLSNAMNVGQIFGLFMTGILSERLGYRKTMMMALTAVVGFIFVLFFAPNLPTLLVGEILMGIPLGVFQTLTVTYASEVCPVVLRCYLTTYVNLCWVMGQLIASGVLRGLVTRDDQWAFRIPFAVQWVWPIPIMIGVFLAPESPWWLVRQGRTRDAVAALKRLTSKSDLFFNAEETVAMMVHTNELEKEIEAGTSYLDCFKGVDLRRTEVVCFVWAAQNLCGAGLMGYSTYFYTQAGLATENAFNMSLGQYAIGFCGTLFSWVLMTHFGRRTLYVGGLSILFILLLAIGFVSLAGAHNTAASWATGSLLLVYTFFYDSTVGPVCYSLVSELSSTRLRAKTIVLSRNLYNIFSIVNGVIIPYMLNPTAWNWRGKAGFFWACFCFLCVVWSYFRLPEPKGRTYGELDVLFQKGVSARKFKTAVVDPFYRTDDEKLERPEKVELEHAGGTNDTGVGALPL
ncbi:sugar porter family MFS transporter [Trichoderma harzianum]|uniref:Sugar porter family MFS transporter n=1 Tax=Trichoderma harzianum TaxID=5544 RepID=A0A0F9WWH3_TRIHA|nr:sugar porter family MFS transporter [Trichoderma harzianum]